MYLASRYQWIAVALQKTEGSLPPQLTMMIEMIKKQMKEMGLKGLKKDEVQLVLRLCKVNAQGKVEIDSEEINRWGAEEEAKVRIQPAVVEEPLPPDWVQMTTAPDHQYPNVTYYYNAKTGENLWERPPFKCTQCNNVFEVGDKFCGYCGGQVAY